MMEPHLPSKHLTQAEIRASQTDAVTLAIESPAARCRQLDADAARLEATSTQSPHPAPDFAPSTVGTSFDRRPGTCFTASTAVSQHELLRAKGPQIRSQHCVIHVGPASRLPVATPAIGCAA